MELAGYVCDKKNLKQQYKQILTLFSDVIVIYGFEGDMRKLPKNKKIPCPLNPSINKHCRGWELMQFV